MEPKIVQRERNTESEKGGGDIEEKTQFLPTFQQVLDKTAFIIERMCI